MPTKNKNLITRFLIWKYKHISERQFIYIVSCCTGLLAGLGAVTLKNFTHFIHEFLDKGFIKDGYHGFYFIFPLIGLALTLIVIKLIIRQKIGHGIPSTLFSISKRKGIMPAYQMWASILTAPLTVGFGGSVGLEGPTVSTASALGSNFARLFHLNQKSRTLLIGCAAAGAMASIFKAPIAAIIFAVEIFSLELTMTSLVPLLLASITAVLTSYFFLGDDTILHFKIQDKFELQDIGFYGLLGIASAGISIYFSKMYFFIGNFFKRIDNSYVRLLIGGALIGIIVFFIPPLFGEGFDTINSVLQGDGESILENNIFHTQSHNIWIVISLLLGLVIFKVIAMAFTFGAGGIGGVFAPTLFIGSISGYIVATVVNHFKLGTGDISTSNFAMVGMAGLMAGVLHAPLTAIFLIAEITGGYELFVPLMIVSATSFLITKKYIHYNIYTAELAKKGQLVTHDKDKTVLMMLDINKVIESDFISITPEMSLGEMAHNAVVKSNRNNFPVVNENNEFLGVVLLDDIRSIMFNTELHETVTVSELMHNTPEIINYDEDSMETVMSKFKNTSAWNLPVIKEGKYYGFISKSRLMTSYRRKLIQVTH